MKRLLIAIFIMFIFVALFIVWEGTHLRTVAKEIIVTPSQGTWITEKGHEVLVLGRTEDELVLELRWVGGSWLFIGDCKGGVNILPIHLYLFKPLKVGPWAYPNLGREQFVPPFFVLVEEGCKCTLLLNELAKALK